jgi:serine/threonine protein kinase
MDTLSCIGRGGYGVVQVAKWQGQLVAVKTVSRYDTHYRHELEVMRRVKSPFIVPLLGAYEDSNRLHLIMQFCCGGDLFRLATMPTWQPSISTIVFYVAQLALTLKFLHDHGVVYGDLKLENVLLDSRGYTRLVDFGMARTGVKRTHGACGAKGSIHTAAPELLRGDDTYGHAVDVWALGCVTYELLTGLHYAPHEAECKLVTNEDARRFVRFMLDEDSETRPTMTGVLNHAFFKDVDWKALKLKTMKAPWTPDVNKVHFDDDFINMPIEPVDLERCVKVV